MRHVLSVLLVCSAMPWLTAFPARACGGEVGSCDNDEDDARYLLKSAIVAVKKDENQALTWFTQQSHGYRTEDLYVFCIGPNHIIDAHPDPKIKGTSAEQLVDVKGYHFGEEMIGKAKAGVISDIVYMWPLLGGTKPYVKHTMYTKVNDQICAVGYYE